MPFSLPEDWVGPPLYRGAVAGWGDGTGNPFWGRLGPPLLVRWKREWTAPVQRDRGLFPVVTTTGMEIFFYSANIRGEGKKRKKRRNRWAPSTTSSGRDSSLGASSGRDLA